MSELRQKLEAWASVANNRAFAFSDAEFGAKEMLALLWPVIEAGQALRDYCDETLATLEGNSRERFLPDDDWSEAMFLRDQYDRALANLERLCG